jgi:hypothetical protein
VQEEVDGAWCHVIDDPGRDRLWIDPAAGYAVRRRERYAGDPPALVWRCELSDLRETAGVWFPWKARQTVRSASPRTGAPNALERHVEADVVEAELNQTSEEFFVFRPPAGTLVQDRDTGATTQVPGGLAFLDGVVQRTAEQRGGTMQTTSPRLAAPEAWQEWAAVLAVFALVVVNLALVVRMWRGTSHSQKRPAEAGTRGRSDAPPQNGRPVPDGAVASDSSGGAAVARVCEH